MTASPVEPFAIDISDEVLRDLNARLARTRWPDQLPGTGWRYGADTAYLRELVSYWQSGFDWRAQQARLNRFDHFRAEVGGTRIHFIHTRSRNDDAIPLLLLHAISGQRRTRGIWHAQPQLRVRWSVRCARS